jgi:hypothetical protein
MYTNSDAQVRSGKVSDKHVQIIIAAGISSHLANFSTCHNGITECKMLEIMSFE